MATSQAPSNHHESSSSRQERKPNWAEFYKHGIPKEVIVIDDDDDSPPPAPVPVPATQYDSRPNANARTVTLNQSTRHADKKRKTAVSTGYDPIYNPAPSYSTTQTPHYINSPSAASISTDRTASALHTTAATSLGSHASINNGLYMPHAAAAAAAEDGVVGQKRKRTRKAVADEAKRRESDVQGDPWSCYVPPPNPPLKARDVHVQVMPDTSYMKHQKVDDDDGHFIVVPDSELGDRYQITKLLGQGTFGKVVEAYDRKKRSKCAIKIIRSVQKYRDASRIELRVLRTLSANDVENRNKCIHLRDCFDYRNHICIVTDLLGQSVFDFLKANQFVPFPSSQIQNFARQLFTSVAFLHDLNLIHTDLKPENILLVNSQYQTFTYNRTIPSSSTATSRQARQRRVLLDSEIRLIDFGSATFDDEYHSSVVSTRHYRAPEIILNLGWSFPCDIWSIGCILVEFFTGDALFQTHDNLEHLAMMEPVCGGRLDTKLVKQVMAGGRGSNGNQAAKYFVRGQRLDYPNNETTRASRKYVKAMKQLHEIIPQTTTFNKQFLDLLRKIFVYDPRQRITAKQALKHPWFRESIVDDGTEATRIRMERERQVNGYR
ncbi:dual specificity tyrosine-phosphorylation-regulated kinase 3 [Xylona heveae TC161]|uniref:dual-specificity kinase n=1 Tax=Xylona heveae (strain CBS 132557 / TC161) TaxID=1328760 RepID=A0A165HVM8_XYLHT|nr:dual specificity tyrosine-phosphorylation-regulated kinase 3 [Xylona heveae TC161]KZF23984.1 dual specificity tyrosine-phosphorylation-regulated kinase 3 [Xylona heveae TC161]